MTKKIKQISFLSAIIIMVAGTIGSGIFFKNGHLFSLAHGNLYLVLSAWIVAGFGIICLGIGIGEMALISKGKKGILEWTKNFLPKRFHYYCKNFLELIFIPVILFSVPIYEMKSLNQSGLNVNAFIDLLIAFCLFVWFLVLSFISKKAQEAIQWIVMFLKFIPLFVLPIIAMTKVGSVDVINKKDVVFPTGLSGVGRGFMILIAGVSAIAFSFDGFYSITTLREDFKEPKKLSLTIIFGLVIVTLFYIFLTIGFGIGSSKGTYTSIVGISPKILKLFSILISIGILGIINGYSQFGLNLCISLHRENQSWYIAFWDKIINKKKKLSDKFVSLFVLFLNVSIMFLVFGMIGIYGWKEFDLPTDNYPYLKVGNLISFVDTLTNYKSLLVFFIISSSLLFALSNFMKIIISKKKRIFILICSIIGITMIFSAVAYTLIESFVDIFGYNHASSSVGIIKFSILIFIILFSILVGNWDYKKNKTK